MGSLTIVSGHIPHGYFTDENIAYISERITGMLSHDFIYPYVVGREDIKRVMLRVLEARLEAIPLMMQRVVMEIVSEIKEFELERVKHLRWEKNFKYTQTLFDVSARSGPDLQHVKLSRQPSTLRFYHTFGTV